MELLSTSLFSRIDPGAQGREEQFKTAGTSDKQSEFKQVAKDMESLFAYQLLKVMRETSESKKKKNKGPGHSTSMSMFDIELSKLLADKGLGLQDSIVRFMSRMENTGETGSGND